MRTNVALVLFSAAAALVIAACDSGNGSTTASTGGGQGPSGGGGAGGSTTTGTGTGGSDTTGTGGTGGAETMDVDVAFEARVGAEPFGCGSVYTGVGAETADVHPMDFRFYVHDVRLVRADGKGKEPLVLEQDGVWQHQNVALLDFEDKTGSCANGTTPTRTFVRGTVPKGDYKGLEFTLGVPSELNHADVAVSPSPLNLSALYWSWASGHVFFAVSTAASAGGGALNEHFVHLGSTGCKGDPQKGEIVACDRPNRPSFAFDTFDPAVNAVVVDAAALLVKSQLLTGKGCHSFPNNPACAAPFEHLGIDYGNGSMTPATQTVFQVK